MGSPRRWLLVSCCATDVDSNETPWLCPRLRFGQRLILFLAFVGALCSLSAASLRAQSGAATEQQLPETLDRFLQNHCSDCHDSGSDQPLFQESIGSWDLQDSENFARWDQILRRVERREMPPLDHTQPTSTQRAEFQEQLTQALISQTLQRRREEGRTGLRRMTRHEYERTVQDLLDISLPLASLLPEESREGGFDRVAQGLRFSPLHIDQWLQAADAAMDEALQLGPDPRFATRRFDYREERGIRSNLTSDRPVVRDLGSAIVLFTDQSYISRLHEIHFQAPGLYRFRIRAWGFQTERPVVLKFSIGNWNRGSSRLVGYWDVLPGEAQEFEVTARVEANEYCFPAPDRLIAASPESHIWNTPADKYAGEGLAIEWIEVEGPLIESWPPPSVHRMLGNVRLEPLAQSRWIDGQPIAYDIRVEDPHQTSVEALQQFATLAFRRPVDFEELTTFIELAHAALDAGETYEQAMRRAVRAILVSPQFLMHQENVGKLDSWALANRLSYFIWGTAPDETLRELAANGGLSDDRILAAQTERMLADPRSIAMVQGLVDQWLDVGRIDATNPDARLYPEFDDLLKRSMIEESHAFFSQLIAENLPASTLVDSDFIMLNRRLAEHYGFDSIVGQQMQRFTLPEGSNRGGVLTQGSILKVTANGTVTSPVTRGVWVQTRLLGEPPPPPPAAVGAIEPDTRGATTIREQLDAHRNSAACASCHRSFDPLGFPLESFDVIGGFRDRYRSTVKGDRPEELLLGRSIWEYKLGPEVDPSTVTSDGVAIDDVLDLKQWLSEQEEKIAKNLIRQLIAYSTAVEVERADEALVETIALETRDEGYRVRDLIHRIVQSELFRNR